MVGGQVLTPLFSLMRRLNLPMHKHRNYMLSRKTQNYPGRGKASSDGKTGFKNHALAFAGRNQLELEGVSLKG